MNFKQVLVGLLPLLPYVSFSGCLREREPTKPEVEYNQGASGLDNLNIEDYCFEPSANLSLSIQRDNTTPKRFLKEHRNVEAVINGVYYGEDFTPFGIAYAAGKEYANGNRKQARGYFSIDKKGRIQVSESLPNKKNYNFVIGTYPLLVKNRTVHSQAREKRYNYDYVDKKDLVAYRSAIGSKKNDICFAVSTTPLTMHAWAELLVKTGYTSALNLDGGPISQLAVRRDGDIDVYGIGFQTSLVIFSSSTH